VKFIWGDIFVIGNCDIYMYTKITVRTVYQRIVGLVTGCSEHTSCWVALC